MSAEITGPAHAPPWTGRPSSLWWLIGLVTLARVLYLALACPYPLVEDEAQYWEWSRRPDWSYYSKGPGIAWTIGASTRLLGDTEFAVRLPAALWGGALALAIGLLASDMFRDRRAGFFAAAITLLIPAFQGTSMVMTIDGPYVACWALASLAAWRALTRGSGWGWPLCGLALAVGFLYKYTILALPVGLLGFAVSYRRNLTLHPRWRSLAAIGLVCAAIGILPVFIWNAQHGWPTVKHLLGHLGVAGGDLPVTQGTGGWRYEPRWTLEFLLTQIGLIGPALLLMVMGTREAAARRASEPAPWRAAAFALWTALPLLIGYLLVTFAAEAEGNWTLGAYTVLACVAGRAAARGFDAAWRATSERDAASVSTRGRRPTFAWRFTLVVGLVSGLGMLRLDWLVALGDLSPRFRERRPLSRLLGPPEAIAQVGALRELLRTRDGADPMIIATHYGIASQLAFGLPDHPAVFVAGSYLGGRKCQHDYWPECDLKSPEHRGRSAIVVAGNVDQVAPAFARIEDRGPLAGFGGRKGSLYIGEGYRGFQAPEERP